MSSWRLCSLTGLALATGVLSPGAMAGDKVPFSITGLKTEKIEFSAPTALIAVPAVVKDDKESPDFQDHTTFSPDREFLEDNIQAASNPDQVIIFTPSRNKEGRKSDSTYSPYSDDRDRETDSSDSDDPYNRSDSTPTSLDGATNVWGAPQPWTPDSPGGLSQKRVNDPVMDNSLLGRMGAMTPTDKMDNQRDGADRWRSPNSSRDSAWTLSYLHHGAPGLEGTEGQYWPSYTEMMLKGQELNQVNSSTVPSSIVGDDTSRNATQVPGVADFQPRRDTESPEQTSATQAYHYPGQATSETGQSAEYLARREPPASLSSQIQPPAILPLPKKPGDLLK
jgi:hypothetical protein